VIHQVLGVDEKARAREAGKLTSTQEYGCPELSRIDPVQEVLESLLHLFPPEHDLTTVPEPGHEARLARAWPESGDGLVIQTVQGTELVG
jgi:hypothetical protein